MYESYIKERENLDVIKTQKGFICYRIEKDHVLINDYFVLPEFRKGGHGYFLANQVFELARELGIKEVFCESDERAKGHDLSKFTIENFGFELYHKIGPTNFYKMEVREWEKR